ncbi:flagellar protein [marine gamma proteobacterium HTCC2207]|jgi:flagellar M-ring protein FliF|uniref:Flagellar M-ring protein n=1 Tax=gamma proteobacterium HTCC2207 TaxID=314287 RepID=Q1YV63_9GAMM|nr:flagellar protein [marine gamma proteobacterium HTCC2207] [gamma proteobacterium HTCC2207]
MATTSVNTTQNMAPAVGGAPGAVSQSAQAQVPAAQGAATTSISPSNLSQIMQQPAVRKAMPAIIAFLSVAVFLIAYSWMQDPVYRTVYPGLSESDRQAAFEALAGADFKARIDSSTGELKVPDSRYHEARIFLAARGLPQEGTTGGISGLSDEASMTSSQFMEQVRYVSAMEQELARSITQINTIRSARVHLASPKQSVFVRNRTPAKASVVVSPYPGRLVSRSQVEAITHMVSSSVPYLAAEDVVVVDQRGKLLTDANNFASMQLNSAQMEHKQRLEETYRNRIDALLMPVVGMGNVRAEVDIQVDYTEEESTYEEYDGNNNGPKARSEVLSLDQDAVSSAEGIPGATTNTVPLNATAILNGQLDGSAEDGGLRTSSSTTTRNYEMDRTVRHVKRQGGSVERISVAVVINEPVAQEGGVNEAGESKGFSELELERFSDLVKGVVGFDGERGDVVTIVSATFETPVPFKSDIAWYENGQVISGIKTLGAAIMFLFILLSVVRPVIKAYLPAVDENLIDETQVSSKDGELNDEEMRLIEMRDGESLEDIKAKLKPKKSTISAEMLDTANTYDDKVALVRLLVAEDSGRVANVLKKMIRPL